MVDQRRMSVELECKVRVPSLAAVRDGLRAAVAEYVGRVIETNWLFDRDGGELLNAGCGLRVRSVEVLDGQGPGATLTYKGPRTDSAFKCREEIEAGIGDPAAMASILHALGYHERVVFEKRRESWVLGSCAIELDELPKLGTFVEVEGPDENAIREALSALGLAAAEVVNESYVAMAAASGRKTASSAMSLCFE